MPTGGTNFLRTSGTPMVWAGDWAPLLAAVGACLAIGVLACVLTWWMGRRR